MKKKAFAGCLAAVAVVAVAAVLILAEKKGSADRKIPPASEWYMTYLDNSYSSLGRLYTEDGFLYFQDGATGEEQIVCDDAVCAHRRESCSAYFGGFITEGIVTEEGDKLLLFTDYGYDKLGELYLYETALNGSQRRQIAKLSDDIQFVMGAAMTDEYIAIAYFNNIPDESEEHAGEKTAGILLYDRMNNTSRELVQITMWNASVMYPTIIGDKVYYEYMGYDMNREEAIAHGEDPDYYQERFQLGLAVCSIDGEESGSEEIAGIDDFNPLTLYNDCILYTAEGQLYSYNVETKETELLGESMRVLPGDGKGGICLSDYDSATRLSKLYRYDGAMQYLGEYTTEWSITAVFENVIYALHYDGEVNSGVMEAVSPETILK